MRNDIEITVRSIVKAAHKNRTMQTSMQASEQRVRAFQQRQKFNFLAGRERK